MRQSWPAASEVLAKALEKGGSASGQTWFDLAAKAREAGNLDIAAQALMRAEGQQVAPVRIGLERTRLNVASNQPAAAVAELMEGPRPGGSANAGIDPDRWIPLTYVAEKSPNPADIRMQLVRYVSTKGSHVRRAAGSASRFRYLHA